ncbi:hypothetical protein ABI59_06595 [Acidobacteria bacterium Mor1]|nr:hypothetical protein ABI59_06595 [Acidobacteria bacterium Mor1]
MTVLWLLLTLGTQGLFVWQPATGMTDGDAGDFRQQQELIRFCSHPDVDVHRLYLLFDPDAQDPASRRALITAADALDIGVWALNPGSLQHRWASTLKRGRPADHQAVLDWLDGVLAYQRAAPREARLVGVQLDIEPHRARRGHRRIWRDRQGGLRHRGNRRVAQQFVELLGRVRERLDQSGTGLRLAVSLPTWYDRNDDEESFMLGGKSLAQHVQDRADLVTLMAYVDDASRESLRRVLDSIEDELEYGPVEIAFETARGADPSLYRSGVRELERLRRRTTEALRGRRHLVGTAVHHYGDAYGSDRRRWRLPEP